jgi:hypothetical protein
LGQSLIGDPRSGIGQLVALSHLIGAAPCGPPSENVFVHLYEASTGHRLESMELFRALWLFQLGVAYHGWRAYGRGTVVLLGAGRGRSCAISRGVVTWPTGHPSPITFQAKIVIAV